MKDFENKYTTKTEHETEEFVLRRAKVYRLCGDGVNNLDDRIQVQVLPNFIGIPKEEFDNLPKYPAFFKNTFTPYKTIEEDGEKECDIVWVICTKDCHIGYILGLCNDFGLFSEKTFKNSYNWKEVKSYLEKRRALTGEFNYKDVVITFASQNADGGLVQGYDKRTGDWFVLNSTGAVITVQQKQIYMRVGSPANPASSGPVGFSSISMTPDKVLIKSPNFELDCQDVVLGKNGLTAGGLLGVVPCTGRNGVAVSAATNIHL